MKINSFSLFSLFILFSLSWSISQQPQWHLYTSVNSELPDNYVLALAVDKDGKKWIGTGYGGLAAFDGVNWEIYNQINSGLTDLWITALAVDENNEIWIGTALGGLVRYDGLNWMVNTDSPVASTICMTMQGETEKWFGTYGGLALFDGAEWKVWDIENSDIPSNTVYSVAMEGSGIMWLGTDVGLAAFDGESWTVYNQSNSLLPNNNVYAVAVDLNSVKWIGTSNGLAKIEGDSMHVYTASNSGLPHNFINGIAIDSENNKWIATFGATGGLAKFDEITWTIYNASNTTLTNYLRSVAVDDNGNVWIGTNGYGLGVVNENGLTGLENDDIEISDFVLEQNSPNPFNPQTVISWRLAVSGYVDLSIYNILGQKIATLISEQQNAGQYSMEWDGSGYPSGVYFYHIHAGNFVQTKRMLLIK